LPCMFQKNEEKETRKQVAYRSPFGGSFPLVRPKRNTKLRKKSNRYAGKTGRRTMLGGERGGGWIVGTVMGRPEAERPPEPNAKSLKRVGNQKKKAEKKKAMGVGSKSRGIQKKSNIYLRTKRLL